MKVGDLGFEAVAAVGTDIIGSRVHRAEELAGSVGNHDFLLFTDSGDFVLKASELQDLAPEAWACQRVRAAGVIAPQIVHLETTAQRLPMPFLLMRRLPGGPVEATSSALLTAAGQELAVVHDISLSGYGTLSVTGAEAVGTSGDWPTFVRELTAGLDELRAGGVITESLAEATSDTVQASARDLAWDEPAVLLHGDFKLRHIFAIPGGRVAIIDWGDTCAGDPRLDLARMSMIEPVAFAAFMSGYGSTVTPELERTLAAYRLVWYLDALTYEYRAGGDWFDQYRAGMATSVRQLRS